MCSCFMCVCFVPVDVFLCVSTHVFVFVNVRSTYMNSHITVVSPRASICFPCPASAGSQQPINHLG